MPNSPDEDWGNWISALIVNLPVDTPDSVDGNQAINLAKQLLAAIDQGGIPTNPIRINKIGRALGLEVLPNALMADTIERIRVEVNKS